MRVHNLTTSDTITIHLPEMPSFSIVKELPAGIAPQIEAAVKDFIKTSHLPQDTDEVGFFNQTLEAIANCTVLGGAGEFWLGMKDGEILIYILAHIGKDIDNRLSYHVSQAWVCKEYRGKPIVKEWWEMIRQRAKDCLCSHLVITSTRSERAYERFLGHGIKRYAVLMKEDL